MVLGIIAILAVLSVQLAVRFLKKRLAVAAVGACFVVLSNLRKSCPFRVCVYAYTCIVQLFSLTVLNNIIPTSCFVM